MSRVFLNALIFGLAPVLQRLVSLILLPLYTHYLTAADYGELELLSIATSLLTLVLKAELRPGFMRAWVDAAGIADQAALLRRVWRALALAAAAGAALILLARPLAPHLIGHALGPAYALALAAGAGADIAALPGQAAMQAQLWSARMVALGLVQFTLTVGLTAYGVVVLHAGPVAFFAGGAIGGWFAVAAMRLMLRPVLAVRGGARPDLAALWRYSLPLLGGALLFFAVRNSDRLAVSGYVGIASLGLYAMGWTLANLLLTMVLSPLQTAYDVWRYEMYRAGTPQELARFTRLAMAVMGLASTGLAGFGGDVFAHLADPRFAQALAFLPWLSLAVLLQAGYSFLNAPFYLTGATGAWLRIFAVGAALQVGLNLTLTRSFGIAGAIIAILTANGALYAGAAWGGRRLLAIAWPHRQMALIWITSLAASLLRAQLRPAGLGVALLLDGAILAGHAALLLAAGVVGGEDISPLLALVRARAARLGLALGRRGPAG